MSISSKATGLRPGICTSTTRPTSPYTGFIIYETDTGYLRVWDGSAWDYLSQKQDGSTLFTATSGSSSGESSSVNISTKPWNMPWGQIAQVTATSTDNTITTEETQLTLTFTAVAGRRYRITYWEPEVICNTNNTYVLMRIRKDNSTGTLYQYGIIGTYNNAAYTQGHCIYVGDWTAGSLTLVGTLTASAGTATAGRSSTEIARMWADDIGPT